MKQMLASSTRYVPLMLGVASIWMICALERYDVVRLELKGLAQSEGQSNSMIESKQVMIQRDLETKYVNLKENVLRDIQSMETALSKKIDQIHNHKLEAAGGNHLATLQSWAKLAVEHSLLQHWQAALQRQLAKHCFLAASKRSDIRCIKRLIRRASRSFRSSIRSQQPTAAGRYVAANNNSPPLLQNGGIPQPIY